MSVRIRLRRAGGTNKPFFRIVATDSRYPNAGRFLENLGWYDPQAKGENFHVKMDRFEYWTGHGAQVSDTIKSFIRKIRRASARPAKSAAAAG
jgi:small subunit ribosomal protein S16